MTTARKGAPRRKPATPKPVPCPVCDGAGEVSRTVRVGRKHKVVGEQSGFCLNCFGTGTDPNA